MRIVLDTKKVTSPVAKFFGRTAAKVQQLRLERCARILANVEVKKCDLIIRKQTARVAAKRLGATKSRR